MRRFPFTIAPFIMSITSLLPQSRLRLDEYAQKRGVRLLEDSAPIGERHSSATFEMSVEPPLVYNRIVFRISQWFAQKNADIKIAFVHETINFL